MRKISNIKYTQQEKLMMEEMFGALDWLDVTTYGDATRVYFLLTERCAYCGNPRPGAQCRSCGAGLPDGSVR